MQAFAVAVSEQDARPRMKYTVVTEGRKLCSNSNLERRVEQSADGVPHSPFLRVRVLNGAQPPHCLQPIPVSPNYKIPANSFHPLHFRVSRSNDKIIVLIP